MSLSSNLDFLSSAFSAVSGIGTEILPRAKAPVNAECFDLGSLHARSLQWSQVTVDTIPMVKKVNKDPVVGNCNLYVDSITGDNHKIVVDLSDSIKIVKAKIHDLLGTSFDNDEHRLMWEGQRLVDGKTLDEYSIETGATLHLYTIQYGGGGGVSNLSLDEKILDVEYNFDFTKVRDDGKTYVPGGRKYIRPYGWNRVALNVKDKYDDTEWIGGIHRTRTKGVNKEWPVTYHGTKDTFAKRIAAVGYDLSKGKRFKFGRGIYSSPDPAIAEDFATTFEFEGQKYKVLLQNRVNMKDTEVVVGKHGKRGDPAVASGEYFITANAI